MSTLLIQCINAPAASQSLASLQNQNHGPTCFSVTTSALMSSLSDSRWLLVPYFSAPSQMWVIHTTLAQIIKNTDEFRLSIKALIKGLNCAQKRARWD